MHVTTILNGFVNIETQKINLKLPLYNTKENIYSWFLLVKIVKFVC